MFPYHMPQLLFYVKWPVVINPGDISNTDFVIGGISWIGLIIKNKCDSWISRTGTRVVSQSFRLNGADNYKL